MGLITRTCEGFVSGMMTTQSSDKRQDSYATFLSAVLAYILAIVILSFVGKLLWNGVVTELISVAKPARSIWHILGLMIFTSLLFP
jgi:uncharacterized membrane protein